VFDLTVLGSSFPTMGGVNPGCLNCLADIVAEDGVAEGEPGLGWIRLLFRHGTTSASSQQAVQNFSFLPIFLPRESGCSWKNMSESVPSSD
jgi:hypothetical protein